VLKKITAKNKWIIAFVLLLIFLSHSRTWAADATLTWYATKTRTNGSALTNLAGYKVYYGIASSSYAQVVNVGLTSNPSAPIYTITNLAAGNTYYFAVTAYDASGKESGLSSEVSKTFAGATTTTTTRATTTTTRTTTTTVRTSLTTTTIIVPGNLPSADALTFSSMTTAPGDIQSLTAVYSDSDGWQNLSDATFYISAEDHSQWLHYNPATNKFSLDGAAGNCTPGQPAVLSNSYLVFHCNTSTAVPLGNSLRVTFTMTPQPALSGFQHQILIAAYDKSGKSNAKLVGNWTIKAPSPG